MKRLYVTDLDGTLLNRNAELSEYTKNKLNELIDKGVLITVASARSSQSIKTIMKDVDLKLPVISFNGAYLTDIESMQHMVINEIPHNLATEIYHTVKNDIGVLISTYKEDDILFYDRITSEGMLAYIKDRERFFNRKLDQVRYDDLDHKVMAFTIIDTKEVISTIKAILVKRFGDEVIIDAWEDMYYKPWNWLTIHCKKATKSNGLKSLLEMVDESISELIVFGDNTNDLPMFELANKSYAVENGVSALKAIATGVIGMHTEDSVVNKINELEG